jgi:P-type conjugative transfer protein TrbL
MTSFNFLNNSLNDFLLAIQGTWNATIQIYGVKILLMLLVVSLGINWTYAISQRDAGRLLDSTVNSLVSAGVLYTIFLNAQTVGAAVLNTFIQIGQATSGLSPEVLTPSGIAQSGFNLALIFWNASSHASWLISPMSAVETFVCSLVVMLAFDAAAIIYLLALVEAWAIIIAGPLLFAFASIPWFAAMLPGWGLKLLSISVKVFGLLAVLAIGLTEAQGWTTAMAANSGSISGNVSLMFQAMTEAFLFGACVYYIPRTLSNLVAGGAAAVMTTGEAMLGAAAGAAGGAAASGAAAAGGAARNAAAAGTAAAIQNAGQSAGQVAATIRRMLMES